MTWFWCEEAAENHLAKKKSCLRYRNNDEHVVRQSDQLTNESSLTHACRAEYTHPGRQGRNIKSIKTDKHTTSFYTCSALNLTFFICFSPANGYISARASPGLLSVSNGNSLGKVVPAKSPPPPSPQMVNSRKPDLRVITSQSGKSLMQLVRRSWVEAALQFRISQNYAMKASGVLISQV